MGIKMDLVLLLGLICLLHDAIASHPTVFKDVHYLGGQYLRKRVSVNYCLRYCQRLGNCWGVDYQYDMRVCSTHRQPSPCTDDARRKMAGVDHFRLKGCREKRDKSSQIYDGQVAELRAHLDAKSSTYTDCLLNIYERSHAIDGSLTATGVTLKICVDLCIDQKEKCKSVDYRKYGGHCYFHKKDISSSELDYAACCHHIDIKCTVNTQPEYDQHGYAPHGYLDKKVKVTTTSSPVTHHHYGTTTHPVSYPPTSSMPTATKGYTTEGYKQASTRSYGKVLTTEAPLVADDMCPFIKMAATSRMGGDIVPRTDDFGINSAEMCKRFCLSLNSEDLNGEILCFGADWDKVNRDCFLFYSPAGLESSRDEFNLSNPNVVHYVYQPCYSLQLTKHCIKHAPQDVPQETAIAGEDLGFAYEIVACPGYCFYNFSFDLDADPPRQLERGCGTGQYMEWRQCAGPPPTTTTVSTECHCVGDFCNAVTYDGLYHLYGYYPFDYNSDDLSGYDHHGHEVGTMKYVGFDKRSANTSAFFDGRSHVEIPSLKLIHRSDVQLEGDVRLSTAVTFWMKRTGGTGEMTILSNSNERGRSSIEFYSKVDPIDPAKHIIVGGVNVENTFYKLESDPVPLGTWYFVALNLAATSTSQVQLYIQDNPMFAPYPPSPNKTIDINTVSMNVDFTSKAVNVGKQVQIYSSDEPYYYEGFLDELRFFQGELEPQDIGALMRKTHYELSFP